MSLSLQSRQRIIWVVVGLAFAYGLYRAISLAWTCDDAFISFRYAQNLVRGNGLIYNIGERVEGYTNFLWTVMMAGGMWAGIDPVMLSKILGTWSFLLTGGILIYLSLRLTDSPSARTSLVFPLAGMAVMLHHELQVWATSGLETSTFTALIALGFVLLVTGNSLRSTLAAGFVLIAAALTRPDGMIFYVMALPYLFFRGGRRVRSLLIYAIPAIIVYLPYWQLRYSYYGYPFPNTYYAKSVALADYGQGLVHLWLYAKTYYILLLVPLAVIAALPALLKAVRQERRLETGTDRALALGMLMAVPYIVYVVRTGGDFMFARFFIPVTPICLVLLEATLLKLAARISVRIIAAFAILICVVLRWPQFWPGHTYIHGIAEERSVYPPGTVEQARIDGAKLKKYLGGQAVTVGFVGTWAMRMYYAELPVAIECHTGLTDEYIAHQPLKERGRPGHEKPAPVDYLQRRHTNFLFTAAPKDQADSQHLQFITFGGIPAAIIVYDNRLMEALRVFPEVDFIRFPEFLDENLSEISSWPPERRQGFLQFSHEYYFDHNQDPDRLAALESVM